MEAGVFALSRLRRVAQCAAPAVAEPGKGLGLMRTPTSAVGYSFFDQGGATPVMRA